MPREGRIKNPQLLSIASKGEGRGVKVEDGNGRHLGKHGESHLVRKSFKSTLAATSKLKEKD